MFMKVIVLILTSLALMVPEAKAQLPERPDSVKAISNTGLLQLSKYQDYYITTDQFKSVDFFKKRKLRFVLDIGRDILDSNFGVDSDPFLRPESVSSYIFNYHRFRLLGDIPIHRRAFN